MNQSNFCCQDLEHSISIEANLINYDSSIRSFRFILHDNRYGDYLPFDYCPWCGTKLPKSLNAEWAEEVKKKIGYDCVFVQEWEKLPEKYKTDQWWKERGL